MNIEVLRIMLTEIKVKTEIAIGGAAALDAITKRAQLVVEQGLEMYRLILLDYSMPELDGP